MNKIQTTQKLLEVLETIKFCDVDELEKIEAINLAITIVKEWEWYLHIAGKRNALQELVEEIYGEEDINWEHIAQIIKEDKRRIINE